MDCFCHRCRSCGQGSHPHHQPIPLRLADFGRWPEPPDTAVVLCRNGGGSLSQCWNRYDRRCTGGVPSGARAGKPSGFGRSGAAIFTTCTLQLISAIWRSPGNPQSKRRRISRCGNRLPPHSCHLYTSGFAAGAVGAAGAIENVSQMFQPSGRSWAANSP